MSRAVCLRCGSDKGAYDRPCPACGHRPEDEGLLVAWLLSSAHLPPERLDAAAARIQRGESVRPSEAMLERARKALGRHWERDPGLGPVRWAGLLAVSLVATPAVAWVSWWWWRGTRPRAARQALVAAAPVSLLGLGWGLWRLVAW